MLESLKSKIVIGFIAYGFFMGLISIYFFWHSDAPLILNLPAIWISNIIYGLLIEYLGDPSSPHAHYTIPWILRIPQTYFIISLIFWSVLGILVDRIVKILRQSI